MCIFKLLNVSTASKLMYISQHGMQADRPLFILVFVEASDCVFEMISSVIDETLSAY